MKQLTLGFAALLLGVLLYMVDRQPDQIFFIHAFRLPSFYNPHHSKLFGEISNNLPSFFHVCSFSLLTSALLKAQSKNKFAKICICWTGVNVIFEIGQLLTTDTLTSAQNYLRDKDFLSFIYKYFQYGSFDNLDILFSVIGGICAYFILINTYKRRSG
jgi:type IV secretory pathway VirB6-like protein